MNTMKAISVLVLAAVASAQTAAAPAKKQATSATTKPASQMAPSTAKKPTVTTKKATMPKPAAKTTPAATAKTPAANKAAAAKMVKTAKPAKSTHAAPKAVAQTTVTPAQRASSLTQALGKRDPFVSVIVARSDNSASCSGGKRCLIVDQLALRGIVRTPSKWIALVENPSKKTYYLYENDPIYNAVVVRITGDSVIFREQIMDALGHQTEREVVKRVNAPAI
jgi:hypothetical protein